MQNSEITTIIPTYRRPQFLKYAIQSALNQTYPNLIVLVCDNASGDETKNVVMSFAEKDARVQYFCQPENVCLEDNFETGLKLVSTPYYSFLCDDDFLLPWFYETAINALKQEPQAMMFGGGTLIIDEKQSIYDRVHPKHEGLWNIDSCQPDQLKSVLSQIIFPACVFKKGDHENIPRKNLKSGWDVMMASNVATNYPIITSSKFVVGYRRHSQAASIQGHGGPKCCLNSEVLAQAYQGSNDQIKKKFRYADDLNNKWKEFIVQSLHDNKVGAAFTNNVIKNHFKITAGFLSVFSLVNKVPIFRRALQKLYFLYMKVKKREQTKPMENEFMDLINKYTFPLTK